MFVDLCVCVYVFAWSWVCVNWRMTVCVHPCILSVYVYVCQIHSQQLVVLLHLSFPPDAWLITLFIAVVVSISTRGSQDSLAPRASRDYQGSQEPRWALLFKCWNCIKSSTLLRFQLLKKPNDLHAAETVQLKEKKTQQKCVLHRSLCVEQTKANYIEMLHFERLQGLCLFLPVQGERGEHGPPGKGERGEPGVIGPKVSSLAAVLIAHLTINPLKVWNYCDKDNLLTPVIGYILQEVDLRDLAASIELQRSP